MKGYYFVNTNLFNGKAHTYQILKTADGINKSGGDVTIVAPVLCHKSNLIRLSSENNLSSYVSITFLFNLWVKNGGRTTFFVFSFISVLFLLYEIIRGEVEYIYFRSDYFYLLALVARICSVPYFYEIHRIGRTKRTQYIKERLAVRAAGVVTLTAGLKQIFSPYNSNIMIAHDGVDLDQFEQELSVSDARKKLGINHSGILCLYIGSISRYKGIEMILRNAHHFPDIHFYIVGRMSMEIGGTISPNVTLKPEMVLKEEVVLYQQAANVLLLPHPKNIYSQSPIKLFEYMASGRAIITSDLSNIREVLNNDSAIFFEPDSDESYSKALQRYVENNKDYDLKGEQNKDLVRKYDWDERGKRILNFIRVTVQN